jgi:TolB-like protein
MVHKTCSLTVIIAAVLVWTGCGHQREVRMTEKVNLLDVKRVAVLPFDNLAREINAGERVTHVFITALHRQRVVQILELGEVERFLIRNRIRSTSQVDLRLLSAMGRELGVDAVLLGIVDEYGYRVMSGEQIPVVGVSLRLLDTRTGGILLAASYSRSGMDSETVFAMGRIRSLTQLTDRVVTDMVEKLSEEFPGRLPPYEKTTWLAPRDTVTSEVPPPGPGEEPAFPSPLEETEEPQTIEEVERERARENGKSRTLEWYEEIKRRHDSSPE